MDLISVIIPTFNESKSIEKLISSISQTLQKTKTKFEIIVADDNSPDGTAQLVETYAKVNGLKNILVICRLKNHGLGNSIKDGILNSSGSVIVGMDADFNHDPKTIPSLLSALKHNDLVVASRFMPGGGMSEFWRMVPTRVVNFIFQVLGMPIKDNTSGFYAIRKNALLKLGLDNIYFGYGDYHLRLVGLAKMAGYKIEEVPTFYAHRLGGVSKSRFFKMLCIHFAEVLKLRKMGLR